MKVLLYGGHFDPITKAHMDIIFFGRNYTNYDAVWFLPSYKKSFPNGSKEDKGASPEDRVKMIKLSIDKMDGIHCCDFEIEHELTNGTYNTIRLLEYKYPGYKFGLLTGSDNANTIKEWKHWQALMDNVQCVVIHRQGHPLKNPLIWLKNGKHILIPKEAFSTNEISSTLTRQYIREGRLLKETEDKEPTLVTKPVLKYILERKLYKKGTLENN